MADLMSLIHEAGFKGQAAQTMYAIVMAESGGNPDAFNGNANTGDQSYGLAQINMLGAMGPARRAEYGLSSNDDLFDPLTNLKVAYKLSNGGTNFSPWSTYNDGAYEQFLGQSGAQVSPQSAGASKLTSGSDTIIKPTEQDYEDALGSLEGLIQAVPELHELVQNAITQGWTTDHFLTEVHQTKYWQQNNAATRQLIATKFSDPKQFQSEINQARQVVAQQAKTEGVQLSRKQVRGLAVLSITNSWSQGTLANKIGSYYQGTDTASGQAAQYHDQLNQLYSEYGLPLNQDRMDNRVQRLLSGQVTMDAFVHNVQQAAKSLYPSIAAQIDGGMTVKDIADPYVQTMANLLEISPDSITLQTPLIKKALQGVVTTTNGKSTASSTPLWQFEQEVRKDPRWWNTDNAHASVANTLTQIGSDWGFI